MLKSVNFIRRLASSPKLWMSYMNPKDPFPKVHDANKYPNLKREVFDMQFDAEIEIMEEVEFEKFQEEISETIKGNKVVEEIQEVKVDEIWGNTPLPTRYYDIYGNKDIFHIPKSENFLEYNQRKISYVKILNPPYNINNQEIHDLVNKIKTKFSKEISLLDKIEGDIEDYYMKDKECVKWLENIRQLIPTLHFSQLSNLALVLAFEIRYKKDVIGIWNTFEIEIFKAIHHMSCHDLIQIKYALVNFSPKAGSLRLHKASQEILKQDFQHLSLDELVALFHASRYNIRNGWSERMRVALVDRKDVIIGLNDPNLLANIMYTYANCRVQKHKRRVRRPEDIETKEAHDFISLFYQPMIKGFKNLSLDSYIRALLAVSITRIENFAELIYKGEEMFLKNFDKIDDFHISNILYAFSKFDNGLSVGSFEFYKKMEEKVIEFWNKFSTIDKSRILYSYAARTAVTGRMKDLFLDWIRNDMSKFEHAVLHNIAYGLMFMRVKDKDIWKDFYQRVTLIPETVPLLNFYPLKLAKYYMQSYFSNWDFKLYDQALYEAETLFTVIRLIPNYYSKEHEKVHKVLSYEIGAEFYELFFFENLFLIDFCILKAKIAIFVQRERETVKETETELVPLLRLKKWILEYHDYKVIIVNYKEFSEMGPKRKDWLQGLIKKHYEEQTPLINEEAKKRQLDSAMRLIREQKIFENDEDEPHDAEDTPEFEEYQKVLKKFEEKRALRLKSKTKRMMEQD